MKNKFLLIVFAILTFFSCGDTSKAHVFDFGQVLSNEELQQIERTLAEFEKKTTVEIVIYTVKEISSKNPVDVDNYSQLVGNNLKLGSEGVNNGVLIFLSLKEKSLRLQLGYGVEWIISQSQSDSIVKVMMEFFIDKKFYEGLKFATGQLIQQLDQVTWNICDLYQPGCIRKIKAKKILEFHQDRIVLEMADANILTLNYTKYMDSLLETIKSDLLSVAIFCRFNSPSNANLLGVGNQ